MKNKKIIITICSLVVIALIAVLLWLLLKPGKEAKTISLTFKDAEYEVVITVKEDERVKLPEVSPKDGYVFDGWYNGDTKVQNGDKFSKDTTIVAKWTEQKPDTMVITFNTDGGNSINPMEIECDSKLNLPTPSKKDYTFVDWRDRNDVVISNETKLTCENITLKANWKKVETSTNNNNPKPVEKKYTCPSGYTLNGTKCTITTTAKEKCGERGFDYNGKCVTITGTVRKETERSCPKEHVTYMSYAGLTEGKVVNWGVWGCAYYKTSDSSKENCESHGFKWVTPENSCYVKWVSNSTINTCDYLSNYVQITNPNEYDGVNGLNGGCFPLSDKTKYCDSGYTLSGNNCIKTIDATLS